MSWSASYPLPRSRSRSPLRGSYSRAPYPEADTYRGDWDSYDRDRSWLGYERDHAPYDYGRRGRSRSPPPDEAGRKRRRSTSPFDRDRYEPRPRYSDDYDTHSRTYGYQSPRRGPPGSYSSSRRPPPDPHTFDFPATLKQYAEWFRFFYPQQALEEDNADKAAEQEAGDGSKPRNGIKSRWEKYKKDFSASQLQTMFEHHRKSPWFSENYDPAPEFETLRERVRKEGWNGRIHTFLLDLEAGKYDPDLDESHEGEIISSVKGVELAQSNGHGIHSTTEDVKNAGGDDDMQFIGDAEEETGDHDNNRGDSVGKNISDTKRSNRGDEISVQPEGNQVMIRTIPPDIGRVKLEEACSKIPGFVYLALGDPLQKRNYYRAGWLKFRDDADMTAVMAELSEKKIEGFKLHVTHNLRPFVNRIRYTPEIASRPERMEKDLASVKVLAAILEEEAAKLRGKRLPASSQNEAAGATGGEEQGDAVMAGVGSDDNDDPEPKERGSDAVEQRIEKVMADMRDQGLVDVNDEKVFETKKTVVALDLYIAYLRAAYNTCYYCSVVTDHLEELQRKCLKHIRKPLSNPQLEELKAADDKEKIMRKDGGEQQEREKEVKENKASDHRDWKRNDDRWLEWLDSKIALLINREGVDPRDYGGKNYEEELSKCAEPYIKQEDEGKYRCKTCQKLFKASSFVEKHIVNKHPEQVKQLDEIPYFNNFALDPHRIQPFAHPPQALGNSINQAPPQAYGIQGTGNYHGGDFSRPGQFFGPIYPQGAYAPPPYHNGYWDPHAFTPGSYPMAGSYPVPFSRRDEATTARRLSDRISGYAPESIIPAAAGLPPKPTPAALDSALVSGTRRSTRNGGGLASGPPPPPPADAKEDPRAAAGKKVSYHDMDLVAEGDVELFY